MRADYRCCCGAAVTIQDQWASSVGLEAKTWLDRHDQCRPQHDDDRPIMPSTVIIRDRAPRRPRWLR